MTAAARRVRIRAMAKINLSLKVLGGRLDGYHELRTTFQSIALHDTLTLSETSERFAIVCDDPDCPTDESNLVWSAADRLWRTLRRRGTLPGVRVQIRKRIPLQTGLGGGSSDAAAALRALAYLWKADRNADRLRAVARELGADVPFFLEGGTVLGVERGDVLFPLRDRPASWVVLVLPPFGVNTADAYRWWDAAERRAEAAAANVNANDLEGPVTGHHPQIARAVTRLRRLGASSAAMSGSGSAVFGLFDSERSASRAAAAVARSRDTVLITRTVSRRRYQTLSRPR